VRVVYFDDAGVRRLFPADDEHALVPAFPKRMMELPRDLRGATGDIHGVDLDDSEGRRGAQ
jgi:hypothetical protein